MKKTVAIMAILSVTAFSQNIDLKDWANKADIELGKKLYAKNCVSCHGVEGVGGVYKGNTMPNGQYTPPALNGTAHTWHHSPELLDKILQTGGNSYGTGYKGWMPEFKDKFSAKDRLAILKYLHSLWPEKIQKMYDERFKVEK